MSDPIQEHVQFYIDACESVSRRAATDGIASLSPIERAIFRAYIFDCERQMGGLTSFFYNTDSSPEVAAETSDALESIGAHETAALFRAAASIVCRPSIQQGARTWGECLQRVDPDGQLKTLGGQIAELNEGVSDLLHAFIICHRSELKCST